MRMSLMGFTEHAYEGGLLTEGGSVYEKEQDHEQHDHLQDSEMTSRTDTGDSTSEEEGTGAGGWFGGIGADFRTLAISLKDTAGGVASFVHRSAVAVAAEIAQLEQLDAAAAAAAATENEEGETFDCHTPLRLPWEIQATEGSDRFDEDKTLKEKILALSTKESTFFEPFASKRHSPKGCFKGPVAESEAQPPFVLHEGRIQLIRRLLEIDENLAVSHARHSGRHDVRENIFWQNYFYHCSETRKEYLQNYSREGNSEQKESSENVLSSSAISEDSLVPAEDDPVAGNNSDDVSYICVPSAPPSMNSIDYESLVLIDRSEAYEK